MLARDYTRISYYMDSFGRLWHGPFSESENVHYKLVETDAVSHSDLPICVEVSPLQAAQWRERGRRCLS